MLHGEQLYRCPVIQQRKYIYTNLLKVGMLRQHPRYEYSPRYEMSMCSLWVLSRFLCMKHHPVELEHCLGQSMHWYEQQNLYANNVMNRESYLQYITKIGVLPEDEYPSCLQTTRASVELQKSSHTVPHLPLTQTSTRPSSTDVPPTSLIWPWVLQAENKCYSGLTA